MLVFPKDFGRSGGGFRDFYCFSRRVEFLSRDLASEETYFLFKSAGLCIGDRRRNDIESGQY